MRQPFILLTLMLKKLLPLFIVCCTLLAGCGASVPTIKPFKMDIQQGNVVTSKMLLQLKPGMTKSQVRFIMGTPLVVDSFHKDRWDYFYQMRQAGKIVEQRRVILDFEKELLTKVRGDVVPQGTAGADTGESNVVSAPITVEPRPKESSMLDKLKFWKKDEKVIAKPDVAAAATEVKVEVANPDTKSKTEKKNLLDKLKFWKKDEPVAAAEKVAPATSITALPTEEAATTTEAAETTVPSVLAVPMLAVPNDVPTAEAPVMVEPLQKEPLKAEPAVPEAMPAPEKVAPKPINSRPVKELATKTEPEMPLPMTTKQGKPLIFRMDKNLDLNRPDEVKSTEVVPVVLPTTSAPAGDNSKSTKADLEPLPFESEPSFFDKMLEKIGF